MQKAQGESNIPHSSKTWLSAIILQIKCNGDSETCSFKELSKIKLVPKKQLDRMILNLQRMRDTEKQNLPRIILSIPGEQWNQMIEDFQTIKEAISVVQSNIKPRYTRTQCYFRHHTILRLPSVLTLGTDQQLPTMQCDCSWLFVNVLTRTMNCTNCGDRKVPLWFFPGIQLHIYHQLIVEDHNHNIWCSNCYVIVGYWLHWPVGSSGKL
jgi:hypothetical protein